VSERWKECEEGDVFALPTRVALDVAPISDISDTSEPLRMREVNLIDRKR